MCPTCIFNGNEHFYSGKMAVWTTIFPDFGWLKGASRFVMGLPVYIIRRARGAGPLR